MKSIILLGCGGHCKSCIDVIETSKKYKIKGIIEKTNSLKKEFMGYQIIGHDNKLKESFTKKDSGFICVGQIKDSSLRIRLFDLLKENNINIATLKSSYSIISKKSKIGIGTITMHNSVVNSGAIVGKNCIINTNSTIEHDAVIDDHCHISTGALINGGVEIGMGSFIGSGVIIKEGIKIGERVLVSAGEIIFKDIPSNTIHKTSRIY